MMDSTVATKPIPHPPKKPIIGNLLALDSKSPVRSLVDLAKQYGEIFELEIMGGKIVFVAGHRLAKELFDEKRFGKTVRGALRKVRVLGGDGLFTADSDDPNWHKAHNILLAPFGARAMQSYHPMMVDVARQLLLKWERLNPDEEIDVVHDMTALTLDTIGLCGFDYRFNSFYRSDYHPFVEALVRSLETVMMMRGLPLENLTMRGRLKNVETDVAFINDMVDRLVADRRVQRLESESQKDLLDSMLAGVDKATGTTLDDTNIRFQIITFLIAGHETTSGLLSYTLHALVKHPDVLKKAYEEVDRVLGPDPSVDPSHQQVVRLTYITQILKEALRLWPPAPAFGVAPYADEIIGGDYLIKKGRFVSVLAPALHRDPEVWGPNAENFDPENFSPSAEAKRPTTAWKPFGNGRRACIGRGFAMHEAALALGMVLQNFRLVDHKNYRLTTKETLTVKPEGFKLKVRPRNDRERGPHPAAAANLSAPAAPQRAAQPGHDTPLVVGYGSNLGTAEEIAHRLAETAELNGFRTTLAPLDDLVAKMPGPGGAFAVVCSSYNGAPPDNAHRFLEWLEGPLPPDLLKDLFFGVFGCGNRDWAATYQSIPRRIDARLAELGGIRVHERGEGDAREDIDGQFETWFAAVRPKAAAALGIETTLDRETTDEPLFSVEWVAESATNPVVANAGARALILLANRELQSQEAPPDERRSTRHLEFALPDGASYRVGDHLAVAPRNPPDEVAAVAARFGLTPQTRFKLKVGQGRRSMLPTGEALSVGYLLGEILDIRQTATRRQIETMAAHTRCPMTKPKLQAYLGDDETAQTLYRTEIFTKRRSVMSLLAEFPACELPFGEYLAGLSLLAPRYYSISSSPSVDPKRCSIMVGVVEGPSRDGPGVYRGVCSSDLKSRREGDRVFATLRPTKAAFTLPDDPAVPLIMIGPGTGLAPFRGFAFERDALRIKGAKLGPALLFFGCRAPDRDFVFKEELEALAARGVVDLVVAFSRHEGRKVYVQDRLKERRDQVWNLIAAGARIYVCGDGSRMEPDVKKTLVDVMREKTGADAAAGAAWIEKLGAEGRYALDVWSGN